MSKFLDSTGVAHLMSLIKTAIGNKVASVTDNNPSLTWGTKSKVGTVDGVDLNVTMPSNPNTDTKVTSAANHYAPSADSNSAISASASGATAAWGIDVVKGVSLSRDAKGHVTGVSVTSGKIPTNPNTDRYVNTAAFGDDTTNNAGSPVKMTLTRAGSDSSTVTANIPKVSSSGAGVVPKGASVSSQSQSTKFLREDGSWAAPSYTTNTDTKVTSAANHYAPSEDSNATKTASGATGTAGATVQVITAIKTDGKGHITGIVSGAATDSRPVTSVNSKTGAVSLSASDVSAIPTSEKGAANGVATLDSDGKVPSSQLPSYVDDVIELLNVTNTAPSTCAKGDMYYNTTSKKIFTATAANTWGTTGADGEAGKIYVNLNNGKTYRWGGTDMAVISETISLGETSSTAYRGDRGKIAYDHSQSTHARTDATAVAASTTNGNIKINGTETTVYTHPSGTNPHGTTKSDVGLGNVGNFKAVSTVASQGLTDTEKSNARANIGAGTSSFSGSYNDLSNKPTIPTVNNGTFSVKTKVGSNDAVTAADFTANQSGADDITLIQGTNVTLTTDTTNRTVTIAAQDTTYSAATTSAAGLMSANDKTKLNGIATGATAVTESTVSGWGFTKNTGTLTSHQTIKQNAITGATGNNFASCTTAAATAAKTANVTAGTPNLEAGLTVHVNFTNANSVASPTLNINSKGAKAIFWEGVAIDANNAGVLSGLCILVYDGTQWNLIACKPAALTNDEIDSLWSAA